MAAYSAVLRGASNIFVVDRVPERLASARKIGCTAIDFTASDPVDAIIEKNGGMVDRAVDCVGYQAVDQSGSTEKPNVVLEQLIRVTRATGGLGVPGLYVPADPGAVDERSKEGQILIPFGKLFEKVRRPVLSLAYSFSASLPLLWLVEIGALSMALTLSLRWIGFKHRHGPMQRQALQPPPARPDCCGAREAEFRGVA